MLFIEKISKSRHMLLIVKIIFIVVVLTIILIRNGGSTALMMLPDDNYKKAKNDDMVIIKDIMLACPPFLYTSSKISYARVVFSQSRLKGIPVLYKNGVVAGIVSRLAITDQLPPDLSVEKVMNCSVKTLSELDYVSVLASISIKPDLPILPVVSPVGGLKGIITDLHFIKKVLYDILKCSKLFCKNKHKSLKDYGIIIINISGEIVCINEKSEKILGLKGKDIIGIHVDKVIGDFQLYELVKKYLEYPKGKWQAGQASLNSNKFLLFKGSNVAGALGILKDESEIDILNARIKRLRGISLEMVGILDSLGDGLVLLNNNGIVSRINTAFEGIVGLSANQILGMGLSFLTDKCHFPYEIVSEALKSKKPNQIIENIKGRDYLIMVRPVVNGDGELVKIIVIYKDISYLNELILNLQLSQEQSARYYQETVLDQTQDSDGSMIVRSMAMRRVVSLAHKVAKVDSNVLITGETGVGKELVARSIHNCSRRLDEPFIKLNCGAIPESLLESELFGYEAGAFTGANKGGKAGLIELSDSGTLFLDEIADLPINLQVKLLRVLQEHEITRLGATKSRKIDFRLIAATNRNLNQMVEEGSFREDLFYRLNVIPVNIPPLRERREDILPLAVHFVNKFNKKYGLIKKIAPEVIQCMIKYDWPGNIRELQNVIERLIVTSDRNIVQLQEMREASGNKLENNKAPQMLPKILEETEKSILQKALVDYRTTREIAEALGISQSAVVKKLKKFGLTRLPLA